MKSILIQITRYINSIAKTETSNEVIDSIIAKISVAGNYAENLKCHLISVEQTIETAKNKYIEQLDEVKNEIKSIKK